MLCLRRKSEETKIISFALLGIIVGKQNKDNTNLTTLRIKIEADDTFDECLCVSKIHF